MYSYMKGLGKFLSSFRDAGRKSLRLEKLQLGIAGLACVSNLYFVCAMVARALVF